ncbi:MAG TPA: type II toxin-antitoxin system VapC family toxin [Roseiarcus sp.]|nr:type II toxin-antitoxin system VapC family toxin [Roseiarcus sp.]
MILLDTNVVSEPLKLKGDGAVLAWLDSQIAETLHLSTISLAELRYGLAALPDGKRKENLRLALEARALSLFGRRILSFDTAAAAAYGELRARARAAGRAIATADGYIAATAIAHGLTVATRDTAPFEAAGLSVINPWTFAG